MRTAHLESSFSGPQWSLHHHQMSLAGGIPGLMSGGFGDTTWPFPRGWGAPYHVTYPMVHLMLPRVNVQMPVKENVTFMQTYLRAVINSVLLKNSLSLCDIWGSDGQLVWYHGIVIEKIGQQLFSIYINLNK